jgi:Flagellar capping protein
MGIALPGVSGTGIDIPTLLSQLQQSESQKLNPYLLKQSSFKGQTSSWGQISSSLDSLKSNLDKLKDEGFNGVSVGTNKAFNATAGKGAIPNSYSVIVDQLAKAHKVGTPPQKDNSSYLGDSSKDTRTLEITVGEGKTMSIELKQDQTSLTQLAKKINAANGDVSASVMPAEGGEFQLVVTSKKTGTAGEIKMEVKGDDKLARLIDYDPKNPVPAPDPNDPAAPKPTQAYEKNKPQNAIIYLDGEKIERSSNTISDALEGITFELRETSERDPADPDDPLKSKPETLSVTADTSKVKSLIEEFVKNYNSFLSTAASVSAYKEPVKSKGEDVAQPNPANGALFGNGTLRRLNSQMKAAVGGNYGEASEMMQSLAGLGITVKFEEVKEGGTRSSLVGTLTIDNKKLEAALKDNPKEVEALFLGRDGKEGLQERMNREIFKPYLGDSDSLPKTEGAIKIALDGLQEQDKRVAKQIENMEGRIEQTLKMKELEFMRLDAAVQKMNSAGAQLQSQLLALLS